MGAIKTVPCEIWTEIFSIPDGKPHHQQDRSLKQGLAEPMNISQVCRAWRFICLDTPQLWTQIIFRCHSNFESKLVLIFLERSQNQPLSVDLSIRDYREGRHLQLDSCLVALFKSSFRWKTALLDLDLSELQSNRAVNASWNRLFSATGTFTLLESLDLTVIQGGYHWSRRGKPLPEGLWMLSPVLKRVAVSVEGPEYDTDRRAYHCSRWAVTSAIPFEQLTHVSMGSHNVAAITSTEAHLIFTRSPNLISCFLVSSTGHMGSLNTNARVVLRHLRHLFIQAPTRGSDDLTTFLNGVLTTPSLVTLTLSRSSCWTHHEYTEFISRSACRLEELYVVYTHMLEHDFVDCLLMAPTLRSMAVPQGKHRTKIIGKYFLQCMTEWDSIMNQFNVCPNLECIIFPGYPEPYYEEHHYIYYKLEFLKKRLCPPNVFSGIFNTVKMPQTHLNDHGEFRTLCDKPWNLDLILEKEPVSHHALWKQFGGA